MSKIAIIGLGLIGGSLGMALKQAKIPGMQVVGHDAEMDAGRKAVKRGAVDKAPWRIFETVEDANVVIIATPILAIRETMEIIADMVSPGCVITDTGSTKDSVMKWAEEYLPDTVSFVGGHPMAGKELSGVDNADASLFKGARYVVIPGRGAKEEAVKAVLDIVEIIGAKPFFIDAYEHDSYVAAVSHLPILLSTALVSATSKSQAWRDMSKLAATGFKDVSRLASGDPVMNLDICVTNREVISHWLGEAIKELVAYRDLVNATEEQDGVERLGAVFAKAWEAREKWLNRYETGEDYDDTEKKPEIPGIGTTMADMFFGSRLRERYQQILTQRESDQSKRSIRRPLRS